MYLILLLAKNDLVIYERFLHALEIENMFLK